jgi:hypothetical protein
MVTDPIFVPPFGVQPLPDGSWRVRDAYKREISVEPSREAALARTFAMTAPSGEVRIYDVIGQIQQTVTAAELPQRPEPSAQPPSRSTVAESPTLKREDLEARRRESRREENKKMIEEASRSIFEVFHIAHPVLTSYLAAGGTITVLGYVIHKSM